MSYQDFAHSVAESQPVTLYEFSRGGKFYRYCNADKDVQVGSTKWEAVAISDGGRDGDNVTITVPSDNSIAMLYRGLPPSQTVFVKIHRLQWAGEKKSIEMHIVWIGQIIEVKRQKIEKCEIVTAGLTETLSGAGLRLTWGRNCPYSCYDRDCRVNKTAFKWVLKITSKTGSAISYDIIERDSSLAPNNTLTAGFIEWKDKDGVIETRAITTHSEGALSLMGGSYGLEVGMVINAYPGCDGRVNTCAGKFNNLLNFGGIPHLPEKSPYDGSRVF